VCVLFDKCLLVVINKKINLLRFLSTSQIQNNLVFPKPDNHADDVGIRIEVVYPNSETYLIVSTSKCSTDRESSGLTVHDKWYTEAFGLLKAYQVCLHTVTSSPIRLTVRLLVDKYEKKASIWVAFSEHHIEVVLQLSKFVWLFSVVGLELC
jgi:hypothetical protein